jgi:hypothetical protein
MKNVKAISLIGTLLMTTAAKACGVKNERRASVQGCDQLRKILVAIATTSALLLPAQAAEKKAKTPEQACQSQALNSIAREWPNFLKGKFEVILKGKRCLVLLQANSTMFEGKRSAELIDGKTGDLLAEFYGPTSGGAWKDSDRGLCSYRGGKFPTNECTWDEYLVKANRM